MAERVALTNRANLYFHHPANRRPTRDGIA